jgi:hypothetical protein
MYLDNFHTSTCQKKQLGAPTVPLASLERLGELGQSRHILVALVPMPCNSRHVKSFHVIYVNSCHLCKKSCHLCQFRSFVNSCQFMSFMSFMSIHVIHVNLCHVSVDFFGNSVKLRGGREGRRGKICLPRPLATASLSGRRQ